MGDDSPAVDYNRIGRPVAFWVGVATVTAGVALTLQGFLELRAEGPYRMTPLLAIGLVADLVGTAIAAWGTLPRGWLDQWRSPGRDLPRPAPSGARPEASSLDDAPVGLARWGLLGRLYLGLVVDTMKPATLGFMLPGLKGEYGLDATTAALFPLSALVGLTVGSVVFGSLGDVIGRRAAFVLTALVFATTAACGFMPGFEWNLLGCFLMGLAAGGELPVIYTLLAETMPARHRGWMAVAMGGIGGLSGYLVAAALAALLEPAFSWRILWLPNLPTALLMFFLLRWVPESPRFLVQMGLPQEARRVLNRMGVHADTARTAALRDHGPTGRIGHLFRRPLAGVTATLCAYGFSWGLCNWGFITWLPAMLRDLGLDAGLASRLLALSAACALPGSLGAAVLYGRWSSKWTAVASAAATAGFLVAFAAAAPLIADHRWLLVVLAIGLLVASSSMSGVLAPYSVELYPTALRGAGSGIVAASSKSGGIVGPLAVGALLSAGATAATPALLIGAPVALAAVLIAIRGTETRGRTLEQLAARAQER